MTDEQHNPQNQSPASHRLMALLNLLEEETRQYEAASKKLQEKQDILIAGKPKKLPKLDQELTAISHKTRQLEKQRLAIMADLGKPNHTLSQLIETLEPKAAADFVPCRDRLLRAAHDAKRMNQDTRDLLQLSLQWIQDTVELIASVLTPEAASYTAQGNKTGQKHSPTTGQLAQSTINHSA